MNKKIAGYYQVALISSLLLYMWIIPALAADRSLSAVPWIKLGLIGQDHQPAVDAVNQLPAAASR